MDVTTTDASTSGLFAAMGIYYLVVLVLAVLTIAGVWRVFTKAGEAGWKSLIPFYNVWVMLEIAGRPGWWLIWFFIPIVNFVVMIILYYDLAMSFGHGVGFTLGLLFLSPIFFMILGFGSSEYVGPYARHEMTGAATGPPMTPA